MKRRLRLWYPAGAISLILLPVFCLLYFKHRVFFEKPHAMRVYCMAKPASSYFVPLKRQDFEITLDGNDREAKTKLDFARLFIKQMVSEQDTVNGIRFKFTEKAKYWMFVRALDICKVENAPPFVTLENDVRAYYWVREKSTPFIPLFGNCMVDDRPEKWLAQERDEVRRRSYRDYLYSLWPAGLLFILMALLAFYRIRFSFPL